MFINTLIKTVIYLFINSAFRYFLHIRCSSIELETNIECRVILYSLVYCNMYDDTTAIDKNIGKLNNAEDFITQDQGLLLIVFLSTLIFFTPFNRRFWMV